MIVFDDLEPSEKVKVYDRTITLDTSPEAVYQLMVGYRVGDMWSPRVTLTEALRVETEHFVECVRSGRQPLTDGGAGLRVVRILEAASKSLKWGGHPVEIEWGEKCAAADLSPAKQYGEISAFRGSQGRATNGSHPRIQAG